MPGLRNKTSQLLIETNPKLFQFCFYHACFFPLCQNHVLGEARSLKNNPQQQNKCIPILWENHRLGNNATGNNHCFLTRFPNTPLDCHWLFKTNSPAPNSRNWRGQCRYVPQLKCHSVYYALLIFNDFTQYIKL